MNRLLGVAEDYVIVTRLLIIRTARLFLRPLFSSQKDFLILNSGGAYLPGLFSELAAVLGLLAHYESWRRQYAGVKVDFKDEGLYYDPAAGENWWEYYFEPIHIGTEENSVTRIVSTDQHIHFTLRTENSLTRESGSRLIDRYVRIKPHVLKKVDSFVRDHFEDAFVIGIHYRGTDKEEEAPRVPYEDVCAAVRNAIKNIGTDRYRLFLATDEQAFVDCMLNSFPNRLKIWETLRSVDGTPNWVGSENNYKKGEDAVIDCLLLSRCHFLIRTASDLSLCSTLFNPSIPEILLNRPRLWKDAG